MANNQPVGVAYSDPALNSAQFTLYTVAQLPAASAALAGTRSAVSNSNAAYSGNAGATVAGGGSNIVPVFCNGTNWVIG
jgi:hypothetical protein